MKIPISSQPNDDVSVSGMGVQDQKTLAQVNVSHLVKRIAKRNQTKRPQHKERRKANKHYNFSTDKNSNFSLIESSTRCQLIESFDDQKHYSAIDEQEPVVKLTNSIFPQDFKILIKSSRDNIEPYADDIFQHLIDRQSLYQPKILIAADQYSEKNRNLLADWIFELCSKHRFKIQTFFLAVNILDRILGLKCIVTEGLAELAIAAVFIASKHEEIILSKLCTLTDMAPKNYQVSEGRILLLEGQILNALNFNLEYPSPSIFISHISKVLNFSNALKQNSLGVARRLICSPHWRYLPSSKMAFESIEKVLKEETHPRSFSRSHHLTQLASFKQKSRQKQVHTST